MKAARSGNPEKKEPALLDAIRAVGELLAAEGEAVGIVVVGGAALVLGGTVSRLTEDVDIIAAVGSCKTRFHPASQVRLTGPGQGVSDTPPPGEILRV
jgi:hypothetical protein